MSGWLGRLFGARTAVESQRDDPVLRSVVQKSAQIFDRIPLRNFITEEKRVELARELYLLINKVCSARNPSAVCREKYAAAMLEMAAYQVLMIRPPPAEDASGLRGQPGISGELHARLVDLFNKNDALRAAKFDKPRMHTQEEHWNLVQCLYWEKYWLLETLNAARIELGDSIVDGDWHIAFLHAACVNAEQSYRWNLEMPSAFAEECAREASTAYSIFTDIVVSGESNPAMEWQNTYRDSGIPMPQFESS